MTVTAPAKATAAAPSTATVTAAPAANAPVTTTATQKVTVITTARVTATATVTATVTSAPVTGSATPITDAAQICQTEFIASIHTMSQEQDQGDFATFDNRLGHHDPITGVADIYIGKYRPIKTSAGVGNADDALLGHAIGLCQAYANPHMTADQLQALEQIAATVDGNQLSRIAG